MLSGGSWPAACPVSHDLTRVPALASTVTLWAGPAFGASLSYFDMCRTEELSGASLVQAQRDYFGSHTFERKDQARDEFYHCLWTDDHSPDTGF